MAPETEAILVELQELFLLPVDDLLRVGRDFLDASLSRSTLLRCLKRNGVNNLKALRAQQLGESAETTKRRKTFKDYEPGFVGPSTSSTCERLPEESDRCFLFAAIDRASKWVYFEIRDDRKAATARTFVTNLIRRAPFRITHLLTDNGLPEMSMAA
ncbi:hypothetical protein [Thiohalorhabdus methylotrophus]|uniref:Integrase catalytic domain-containing protein n=1 Tax=Thiohalorhabdus methylotrophus TaxID=3242694 RepID=A0ABV4TZ54_9GAMM